VENSEIVQTKQKGLKSSGALFGMVVGAGLAIVQVTLYMMGSATYDVTQPIVAGTGSNDFAGMILIPVALVLGCGAASAYLSQYFAKKNSQPSSNYF